MPRALCSEKLTATVASVAGGVTAFSGSGIWIDGSQAPVAEPVTLLLVSGTESSVARAVEIILRHLADGGEEAVYILEAGSARIVRLGNER